MTSTSPPNPTRALTVLVVGASGYLGAGVCNAFVRATGSLPGSREFRVYGLVRRAAAARALAVAEVIPVVASLDDRDATRDTLLGHSPVWDVIVTCTEPPRSETENQHWDDVLALVQGLSASSVALGTRTMVLWSSGCKDYGMTALHGAEGAAPHTEESPLEKHHLIDGRIAAALRALEVSAADGGAGGFDVAILRSTPICGYIGSYYGGVFDYTATFAAATPPSKEPRVLKFTANADTILHGVHLDDCAGAYLAVASAALFGGDDPKHGRPAVAGQVFNISGKRYETLREIGSALAAEYGFDGGAQFGVTAEELPEAASNPTIGLVLGWSQWVSSDKIRSLLGWSDRRLLFVENLHVYRLGWEAAAKGGSSNVDQVRKRLGGNWGE